MEPSQLFLLALAAGVLAFWRLFLHTPESRAVSSFWRAVSKVGVPAGPLGWTRAAALSPLRLRRNAHAGYARFSKPSGTPFALPTTLTGRAVVVLPPSQLHLLNRPAAELSGFWPLIENIQLHHFIPDREVVENVIHFEVTRKDLTRRNVQRMAGPAADEIDHTYRQLWGTDAAAWTTINGWEKCGAIIARAGLRSLVGFPLCRNRDLLRETQLFADSLFASAGLLNCMPPSWRDSLAPIFSFQAKRHARKCLAILKPFVQEQMDLWEKNKETDSEELPSDFLHWLIPRCAAQGPQHLDAGKIATRLIALNTMFVFGMSYVFAHTVADLCASPDKADFFHAMEAECRRVVAEHPDGLADSQAVDRLFRVDSAIRESMRYSDVGVVTMPRDVMGSEPLDLGHGLSAPPGTRLVFPTQSMHMDPAYHEDPQRFDALRFSRPFEKDGAEAEAESKAESEAGPDSKPAPPLRPLITTPGPGFMALGYGRATCPGRFYVAQTIKQSLAYLVMNYDVELEGPPPKRQPLLNMMIPPMGVKLRIRRKSP